MPNVIRNRDGEAAPSGSHASEAGGAIYAITGLIRDGTVWRSDPVNIFVSDDADLTATVFMVACITPEVDSGTPVNAYTLYFNMDGVRLTDFPHSGIGVTERIGTRHVTGMRIPGAGSHTIYAELDDPGSEITTFHGEWSGFLMLGTDGTFIPEDCPTPIVLHDPTFSTDFTIGGSVGLSSTGDLLSYSRSLSSTTKELRTLDLVSGVDSLIASIGFTNPFNGANSAGMTHDGVPYWVIDGHWDGNSSNSEWGYGLGASPIATFDSNTYGTGPEIMWDATQGHWWVGTWGDTNNTTWGDDATARNEGALWSMTLGGSASELFSEASHGDESSPAACFLSMKPVAPDGQGGVYFSVGHLHLNEVSGSFISWDHDLRHYSPTDGITTGLGHGVGFRFNNIPLLVTPAGGLYVWSETHQCVAFISPSPDLVTTIVKCLGPETSPIGNNQNNNATGFAFTDTSGETSIAAFPQSDSDRGPWGVESRVEVST